MDPVSLPPLDLTSPPGISSIVARARTAQGPWAARPAAEREEAAIALGRRIVERRGEVIAILQAETGRDPAESLLSEVTFAFSYAKAAVAVSREALAPRSIRLSAIDYPGKRARVEAVPRGVIAIIEPWNYPLLQFFKPLFPALLSGNSLILKPSEHAPRTCAWLVAQCAECLPPDVVQAVYGDGAVGAALVDAEVDAVVFCGSVATGRKVAVRCAERLVPCSVELGGKDAAIVLADCDLERTIAGVLQWSMHNAGQDCSSIERIYVEEAIADHFATRLAGAAERLRVAPAPFADLGPVQTAEQLAVIERHVADAVRRGAVVLCGGGRTGEGFGYLPTVLDRCTEAMEVVREETFGPVAAVIRVRDVDEAITSANASRYGLSASVWTRDLRRGEAIARRLDVGTVWVNNHSFTGSVPQIPWTGTKDSGYGTAGSVFSYATFVRRRTIVVDRSTRPDVFWRPVDADLLALGHAASELALGAYRQILRLIYLVGRRIASIRRLVS